jgi:hypothetical protein
MIALVMGFLAVDQMMLESERIVWLDSNFVFRPAAAEIVVNMGNAMVDDHDHSPDLVSFRGLPKNASVFQEFAQPGNLFDGELLFQFAQRIRTWSILLGKGGI